MSQAIKVVVRVRPMNNKEKDKKCQSIVQVDTNGAQLAITKPDETDNIKIFAFDNVFSQNSTQESLYQKTAYGLVENVLMGYNGTIFAYGQTGCGKTHSMVGQVDNEEMQGIIPRSFGHVLKAISQTKHKEFLIRCSFIQIYNQETRDLLGSDVKAKLQLKESPDKGVFIKDLSLNNAKTHQDLMNFMNTGNKNRSVGETAMNKDSSRSHLLFMLFLQSAQTTEGEDQRFVASKLNLVDLAGSERLSKTGAAGDRLKEAQKINLSLSALGNVISALVDGKSNHIPYRDSKLTRLLQDSLGGNTKTVMIANCSPADYNYDQTLSTLRYASRAKFIKNKPIINQDPKDALLRQYANEIKKLKSALGGQLPLNQDVQGINNDINTKLKEKEEELRNQKEQKEKLMQKLKLLESQSIEAKDVHVNASIISHFNRMSLKQTQKQLKTQNALEDATQEPQSLNNRGQVEQKYKKIIKRLQEKVHSLQLELKDINHENYLDKQIILEDVRYLTKENKLLEAITSVMLQPTELEAVRDVSEYNQEKGEYHVPPFFFKNKELVLPKLQENQALDMIRHQQDGRELLWEDYDDKASDYSKYSAKSSKTPIKDLAVRNVLKEARDLNAKSVLVAKEEKKAYRKQLEPLCRN